QVIDSLPHSAVPTLVIIGAGDAYYLQGAEYMASRIPGAEHVVVADAGHGVNVDQPERVNAAFEAFLGKL
ncbi:MAG: alpha/beta hydrolase, partial [Rickettsiales bacterium]